MGTCSRGVAALNRVVAHDAGVVADVECFVVVQDSCGAAAGVPLPSACWMGLAVVAMKIVFGVQSALVDVPPTVHAESEGIAP